MAKSLIAVLAAGLAPRAKATSAVWPQNSGWFGLIREPFAGAWQRDIVADAPRTILAFSAVFACVTVIATDVAKLRIKLVREDEEGICEEIKTGSPFLPVLRKPNGYQLRIKFVEQWIVSKLLHGNAYVLKERDARGIVVALYVLDPQRVTVLVSDDGGVYYRCANDELNGLPKEVTIPASEIIHDMMVCLWHPLVGVSPLYAAGISATQGNRIQSNSTKFFQNMSRPSGVLTTPDSIADEVARKMKNDWEENFGQGNVGRVAVLGGGLKYEAMGAIPAQQAQLIEQLRWTVEDVARCFHVPLYKIGGPVPTGSSIEQLNQGYYSDCLQTHIESAEACLDEGLALPSDYYTEFDLDGLLRMDTTAMVKAEAEAVGAGIKAPNESRARLNLKKVSGGESPYLQQQNYSLAALAKRDAKEDPFGGPAATPAPAASDEEDGDEAANDPAPADEEAAELAAEFRKYFHHGVRKGAAWLSPL